jgi:hypothetical protein
MKDHRVMEKLGLVGNAVGAEVAGEVNRNAKGAPQDAEPRVLLQRQPRPILGKAPGRILLAHPMHQHQVERRAGRQLARLRAAALERHGDSTQAGVEQQMTAAALGSVELHVRQHHAGGDDLDLERGEALAAQGIEHAGGLEELLQGRRVVTLEQQRHSPTPPSGSPSRAQR